MISQVTPKRDRVSARALSVQRRSTPSWKLQPKFALRTQCGRDAALQSGARGTSRENARITYVMDQVLPGDDLIEAGLRDLRAQRETTYALIVAIGAPRLRRLGLDIPDQLPANPEHRLYDLLASDEPDSAHTRYNALIRRLVSFERAAECVRK